ncbi:MAG: hypothetical protein Q8Q52_02365, partial [Acidimicrobiia bacterium]|nr:hypothetical protein [Acidimicrobiia bacterium]
LWSSSWEVAGESSNHIDLSIRGPVTGALLTKKITVEGSRVTVDYRLEHTGAAPLHHMFKLHPAIAINDSCSLELPGGRVEQVDPEFGNILGNLLETTWLDVRSTLLGQCRPARSGSREFVYVSDLPAGWCGVADLDAGARLRIEYPQEIFPYCWLFITYGGWRDHNVVVLEPCTNHPKDLATAVARGTSAVLAPGEVREFTVAMTVEGL